MRPRTGAKYLNASKKAKSTSWPTISTITITENAGPTTSSREFNPSQFEQFLSTGYTILRYKFIEGNTDYTPLTEFVAVEDEIQSYYVFNDDLCPNYGNKSNYIEGDDVIINVTDNYKQMGYTHLSVYKDEQLYNNLTLTNVDVVLKGLPFGDYKVCLTNGHGKTSRYAFFKVVNMSVSFDNCGEYGAIIFNSINATPIYYEFCGEGGKKGPSGAKCVLSHMLSPLELSEGRATLSPPLVFTSDSPYVKIHFETEYGRTAKTVRIDNIN